MEMTGEGPSSARNYQTKNKKTKLHPVYIEQHFYVRGPPCPSPPCGWVVFETRARVEARAGPLAFCQLRMNLAESRSCGMTGCRSSLTAVAFRALRTDPERFV